MGSIIVSCIISIILLLLSTHLVATLIRIPTRLLIHSIICQSHDTLRLNRTLRCNESTCAYRDAFLLSVVLNSDLLELL